MYPMYQNEATAPAAMTPAMWVISLAVFAFVIFAGVMAVKISDRPDPTGSPSGLALVGQHEELRSRVRPRGSRHLREVYDKAFDTAVLLDSYTYRLADRAVAVVMSLGHETEGRLDQLRRHETDVLAFGGALRSYAQGLPGAVDQLELALGRLEPELGLLVS